MRTCGLFPSSYGFINQDHLKILCWEEMITSVSELQTKLIQSQEPVRLLTHLNQQNKALKSTEEVSLQILLLCQVAVGTVANVFLFVHNFSSIFTVHRLKPTQVIVTNFAVANIFILLTFAFPNMMVFVPRKPPTDFQCKIEFFISLVARSTNMCSTSVLSTYQFITLVPGNWVRLILRVRAPNVLSYSCYSCWFFSILSNAYIPIKVSGPQSTENDTENSKWVCSTSGFGIGMASIWYIHDAMLISIMAWTSLSMVIFLHRHHQRMQHIFTRHQDHKGHSESRAAYTILMLVGTFVSFYVIDCIFIFFHISLVNIRLWMRHVKQVLATSFPTISPFLLIFRDAKNPCSIISSC